MLKGVDKMARGTIKHGFLGGNTPQGFYSYYRYILDQQEAVRIISIKGGPGVGKSTFMRKIGEAMLEKGYGVEYMHCSSDNHSLDGVVIPAIKVALLDGTAPHVVDPIHPGAVDEILNLGEYWNEEGISRHKQAIIDSSAKVGKLFARAYRYLAASKEFYDDMYMIYQEATKEACVNKEATNIIENELQNMPLSDKVGKVRKLFVSAITPSGLCNELDSIVKNETVYKISGESGTGTEKLIKKVREAAIERGLDVESYYCPMQPEEKLEHIVISKIGLTLTTSNQYHDIQMPHKKSINLMQYVDNKKLDAYKDTLYYDKKMFEQLLNKSIDTIKKAKEEHDYLETFYIPNMHFDQIEICLKKTLTRIETYTLEY